MPTSRPALHFTPERGWINDPYGLTWHEGRYHLFFQHVPDRPAWAPEQHWGHAVSTDLVHWTERPVALAPGEGDDGIWSGSLAGGRLFYTAMRSASPRVSAVRVARPVDGDWDQWVKEPGVAGSAPPGLDLVELRDPFVLRDGAGWRMVLGGGTADGTALALSWTSPDLDSWTYAGVLASGPSHPAWTGTAWECPQLFPVDGRWVLVVSVWAEDVTHHVAYAVGDLVDGRFEAGPWHRLTYGAHYAASHFVDRDGRPCLIHWLRGVADPDGRWAGALSVPHVVSLVGDRIRLDPHPALLGHADLVALGEQDRAELDLDGLPDLGEPLRALVDGPVAEVFGPGGVAGVVR